jgi:hypothetical protein
MSQTRRSSSIKTVLFCAAMLSLASCGRGTPGPYTKFEGLPPDGTVEMHEVQAAYIGNAGGGSGTLFYRGGAYPLTIAGLGVGGIGVSTIDATGDVYKLPNISLFPGSYAQGSTGFVIGNISRGDLWLQNGNGVVMHLRAKREGLMLTLGGDAIVINMKR